MSWDYQFANELKKRNNKVTLGNMIGKVESISPLIVSALGGSIMLEVDDLIQQPTLTLSVGDMILLVQIEQQEKFYIVK